MSDQPQPTLRRKFVLMDPHANHNKSWMIEFWEDKLEYTTTWGRIGASEQKKTKPGTRGDVEQLISEKQAKGYTEIDLHIPRVVTSYQLPAAQTPTDQKVNTLLQYIFDEAGQHIKSYLAVGVDALSETQLNKGRQILSDIVELQQPRRSSRLTGSAAMRQQQQDLVLQFCNTIPTKLPARLRAEHWDSVVDEFLSDLHEQEDRLDQLQAALASYTAQISGQSPLASLGGVDIKAMDQSKDAYKKLVDYIKRTAGGRVKIHDIFSVTIPAERATWQTNTIGTHCIVPLFHGTRSQNVRHILRSGLIIPQVAANGRRCGDGIYFSDRSQRSLNYCAGSDHRKILFAADVAVGTPKVIKDTYSGSKPPPGYDSIHGVGSWSASGDEFVVFSPSQQTLRAIVVLE